MRAATEKFRSEMDVLGKFIADACMVDDKAEAGSSVLFAAFVEWAKVNNERGPTQKAFGTQLGERGFDATRDTRTGRSVGRGQRLLEDVAIGGTDIAREPVTGATSKTPSTERPRVA